MPKRWKLGHFDDIITEILGGDWGKENPQGNYIQEVYCIRGADIPEIQKANKGKMPIRYILNKNYITKKLEESDLVVEISGGSPTQSTGRIAVITKSLLERYQKDMICTNFCRALKPLKGYSIFIYYYWQYLYDRGIMFIYENGTTGIKNFDLNSFLTSERIIIPPLEIVKQFSNSVEPIINKIYSNGFENEKLSELRDTLLPKLMNGKIDVSNISLEE